jgi:hypothetical protein
MIQHIATDENFDGDILRGVFVIDTFAPIGLCINELATIIGASDLSEWDNLVIFIPFP